MEEEPAAINFTNAKQKQPSATGASPTVKFTTAKIASLTTPASQKRRPGGLERCAVSFASGAIRLNDLLSSEAEDASTLGSSKDSDDNMSQSSVLTAVSEPVDVKVSESGRRLELDNADSDSVVSSPRDGDRNVRRRFPDKLSRRWKAGENQLSAGCTSVNAQEKAGGVLCPSDRESVESNESNTALKGEKSKLAIILDKAKSKGKKLVSSNKAKKSSELVEQACQAILLTGDEVDASVSNDVNERRKSGTSSSVRTTSSAEVSSLLSWVCWETVKNNEDTADADTQAFLFHSLASRCRSLPLFRQRMLLLLLLISLTFIIPGFISGFLWGLYLSFIGFLYFFVSEPVSNTNAQVTIPNDVIFSISEELKQRKTMKNVVYKGWMNELRGHYDSATYHVNSAQSVLVRLDGHLLRISRPERNVLKHSFHTDPTLSEPEPTICGQSIYDLTGAVVSLRPKRLAKRRWWSRKYPIHIRLASSQSEISTIDTTMQRSQSAHQSVTQSRRSTGDSQKLSGDLQRSDSVDSGRSKAASMENSVSDSREQGYDPDESSEDDEQVQPAAVRSGRACSVGDVSTLPTTGEREGGRSSFKPRGRSLFLFVRSAREKERWFHRLREACSQYRKQPSLSHIASGKSRETSPASRSSYKPQTANGGDCNEYGSLSNFSSLFHSERRSSLPSIRETSNLLAVNLEYLQYVSTHVQFQKYMLEVLRNASNKSSSEESGIVFMDLGRNKWKPGDSNTDTALVLSANAVAARIFYDFCRDAYWVRQVQEKIQSKLATIHLPYFIETLELSSLDLGTATPQIVSVYPPILDDWGLWIDFELKYRGGIHLVLETRVNLMKLKSGQRRVEAERKISKITSSVRAHHYSDEDLPESPESSPDEDFGSKTEKNATTRERTGKRILSMVDKIASSKYFQGASELKAVKKMMEEISSTRLMLNVEVTCLEGPMTINIPPPPSDRLWYAFRRPPKISIRSVPQVGDRSVDMSTVSDWIENKLRLLLEKNLVCPNMDDVVVPVMSGNELLKGGYNK
uniref:Testis-expressed sequence 2 protein n=2 Tax=Ascaris TaxID=6251 RepID=F1KTN2_ASCSU